MKAKMLMIAVLVFAAACKKEAKNGTNGTNGNTIISGAGNPKASIGVNGDYFIDTLAHTLWGPKNGASWGNGLDLMGKTMSSGAVNPTAQMGNIGDMYFNVMTKMMFGPKTESGWGAGFSVVGPTGSTGKNAEVIYTTWATSPTASSDSTIDGTCVRVRYLYPKSLTTSIVNNGVLLTYMRVGSIGPYNLPYVNEAGGATNQVNCIYGNGKVAIYRHTYNTCRFNSGVAASYPGQPVMVNLPQGLEYRMIFIPGALPAGPAGGNEKNPTYVYLPNHTEAVDLKAISYEELCKLINIQK